MKLYNIFESVILEEVEKAKQASLLTESVSHEAVLDAIKNKYNVNITYNDYPDANPAVPPSKRYIQVYNFSDTSAGNEAIRAFQIMGGSKTGAGQWKIFRLDRIIEWHPTKMKFYRPVSDLSSNIPKYNNDGDKTMSAVHNKVDFDQKYNDTNKYPLKNKQ